MAKKLTKTQKIIISIAILLGVYLFQAGILQQTMSLTLYKLRLTQQPDFCIEWQAVVYCPGDPAFGTFFDCHESNMRCPPGKECAPDGNCIPQQVDRTLLVIISVMIIIWNMKRDKK